MLVDGGFAKKEDIEKVEQAGTALVLWFVLAHNLMCAARLRAERSAGAV